MYVTAALSPPLGSSTVKILGEKIRFIATLNVPNDCNNEWTVQLWWGRRDEEWRPAAFAPASAAGVTVHPTKEREGHKTLSYVLDLENDRSEPLEYTLRLRKNAESPWIWTNSLNETKDGQIIFRPSASAQSTIGFEGLFTEVGSDVSVAYIPSQVSDVQVFDVTAPAPVKRNGWTSTTVGRPTLLEKFYSLVKISSPWMGPTHGSAPFMIDKDALLTGYVRSDGRHVAVLAISSIAKTTYIRSGQGKVLLKTRNDTDSVDTHRAIVATGYDWQKAVDAAFYAARDLSFASHAGETGVISSHEHDKVKAQWHETWYDGLGYCTWNSLGRELTHDRILNSLQDLHDNNILIRTLIIDDNWQSLDNKNRWMKWEANSNFPKGLSGLTSEIRRRFPYIKHIAVWHSILGYWEGFSPDGEIAKNYKMKTTKWHGGHDVTVVDPSDVKRFYNDFYSFLSKSGIDAVKADVQVSLTDFDDAVDRLEIGRAYQDAFKVAGLRHFAGQVIYCMGMQPPLFFHSLLPRNGPTTLVRNSDDFFPNIPSSHLWHVFCNALNNIFTSHLNALPDWDMFQSSLPEYGELHAAGRCISGGPIYITDTPGQHNVGLVRQMAARSVHTPTYDVILRPSRVSLPIDPYIGYKQPALLKVGNYHGGYEGNPLLVVFNVSESGENTDTVSLADFRGALRGKKYAIRAHTSGRVWEASHKGDVVLSVTLPTHGWEYFSAVPIEELTNSCGQHIGISPFGLTSSMAGAAAIMDWDVKKATGQVQLSVTVKALGVLSIYISDLAKRRVQDLLITLAGKIVPIETVRKSTGDSRVLDIDIEKAWSMLKIDPGVSNEVTVAVYLN